MRADLDVSAAILRPLVAGCSIFYTFSVDKVAILYLNPYIEMISEQYCCPVSLRWWTESVQLHSSSSVGGYLQHSSVSLLSWKSHMQRCERFAGISTNVISIAAAADNCAAVTGARKDGFWCGQLKSGLVFKAQTTGPLRASFHLSAASTSLFPLRSSVCVLRHSVRTRIFLHFKMFIHHNYMLLFMGSTPSHVQYSVSVKTFVTEFVLGFFFQSLNNLNLMQNKCVSVNHDVSCPVCL